MLDFDERARQVSIQASGVRWLQSVCTRLISFTSPLIHTFDSMCRAIKTLHNFSPPATNDEIRASSLQFVRKLSGFTKPSKANEAVFDRAVDDVAHVAQQLLDALVTNAPPRDRAVEVIKTRVRSAKRFGSARAIMTDHNHN